MSAPKARLLLASDPSKAAPLDPKQPLTIGKAPAWMWSFAAIRKCAV